MLARYDVLLEELRPHGLVRLSEQNSSRNQFFSQQQIGGWLLELGPSKSLIGFVGSCGRDPVLGPAIAGVPNIDRLIKKCLVLSQSRCVSLGCFSLDSLDLTSQI